MQTEGGATVTTGVIVFCLISVHTFWVGPLIHPHFHLSRCDEMLSEADEAAAPPHGSAAQDKARARSTSGLALNLPFPLWLLSLPSFSISLSLTLGALEIAIVRCSSLPPPPTLRAPFSRRMRSEWLFEAAAATAAACLLSRLRRTARLLT
jgi:hypothetical protein